MTYKAPNLKGSRIKRKSSHVMSDSLFLEFKKKHPEYKDMILSEFNAILRQFNNNIIDEVIDYRFGVALPERLGLFVVASFPKSRRRIIDFGANYRTTFWQPAVKQGVSNKQSRPNARMILGSIRG